MPATGQRRHDTRKLKRSKGSLYRGLSRRMGMGVMGMIKIKQQA